MSEKTDHYWHANISRLTPEPPEEVQTLVESIHIPNKEPYNTKIPTENL